MADNYKADRLSSQFQNKKKSGQSSELERNNLRYIEEFVSEAAEADGIISVYRKIDEREKSELEKTEVDEIANAYHVEMAGENKVHYITYKPQVERGKGSKLEHVNRSTPFVQMLLDKVGADYSFLYCHSKVRSDDTPLPPVASGFSVERGEREHLEGKNKYELFFLIECQDNIDASESMKNIIDSVLLDVDGSSGDFFANMSYATLERSAPEDGDISIPQVDYAVQSQLNNIITQIRESSEVRQRILDFMVASEGSKMREHIAERNEVFRNGQNASHREVNALGSSVICRMMPIGVFLNAIDNDRVPYTVTGRHGERATFYVEINPTTRFNGHVCPHCGEYLSASNGAVAVSAHGTFEIGCEKCATECEERCGRYCFRDDGCRVCGKALCSEHSIKSIDSNDKLCSECAKVFRDGKTGSPLSPRDAAMRGCDESYVEEEVKRLGKVGALNRFRSVKFLRKSECMRCRTKNGYKYYLREETAQCFKCGEFFYRDDIKETTDTGEALCIFDRIDCSCGNIVAKEKAHSCSEEGCINGFCSDCAKEKISPNGYYEAVKLISGRPRPLNIDGKIYCPEHSAVCKVCGKVVPLSKAHVCTSCGGTFCNSCGVSRETRDGMCTICNKAFDVNGSNFKSISSKTRLVRLNALPFFAKFKKTAVLEDNENIVFVTVQPRGNRVRVYSKLKGSMITRPATRKEAKAMLNGGKKKK